MKSNPTFVLAVCESFRREAESLAGAAGFEDVSVRVRPTTCHRRWLGWEAITDGCPAVEARAKLFVAGGFCVKHLGASDPDPSRIEIGDTDQCLCLLAGKAYVDHCQGGGQYVLSPGWLEHWQERMRDWGFDQAMAREFFGESMKGLLMLDTGLYPDAGAHLEAMAEFVGLPASSTPVGMDMFRRSVSELVLRWRLKSVEADRKAARTEVQGVAAHSAMVLDLMHRLIDVRSEAEVIQQGIDLCKLLFAPESAVFDGAPAAGELADTCWTPDGRGFRVRVRRREADFGALEVRGVAFPESKGRYLATACTIGGIMALAISNARAYQALEEEKNRSEAATHAKSDFLSSMSHEIRTPMNGVVGMVDLLLTTELSTEQRHYAELAQSSGRTLLALIDDILDLAKVEAGKVTLETLDFNLRSTLSSAISTLALRAESKGLVLSSRTAADIPRLVRGDANRLRQVLINLIANAIKFTDRGEIAVQVTLGDETDAGSTVRFAVIDTGAGIPQARISAVFAPFVQADDSTTRKHGGTGLGLAISRQLVELMGGKIGVESREGMGSTFWFTVDFGRPEPLSNQEPERIGERPVTRLTADGPGVSRRQRRILVAEDDPTNQAVARAQLVKLGFKADIAATGLEAVRALEAGEYDLILMDCHMPEMDGYEATRRIRASGRPDIPIVALTADAMRGHYDRCIREGMNDFLSKPVALGQLSEMLAKWLPADGAKSAIQSAPAAPGEAAPVFDEGGLLGRLMNDRTLAHTVLDGFLQDCPVQLALLSERLLEADAPGTRRQAHRIKGAAACVSAEGLRGLMWEMEQAAKANDLDRAGALLPRATEAFERLKTTLQMAGWLGQNLISEFKT